MLWLWRESSLDATVSLSDNPYSDNGRLSGACSGHMPYTNARTLGLRPGL